MASESHSVHGHAKMQRGLPKVVLGLDCDFDVIIDDGGHTNCQIWTSFQKLWPTVKPGGLYFIEDMQVAKRKMYKTSSKTCNGTTLNVPDMLTQMKDKMMYKDNKKLRRRKGLNYTGNVEYLFCQPEACVLQKKHKRTT